MGRKRREWIPHAYHHIYARGNNRQNIFCDSIDMMEVFRLLTMIHNEAPISICAYCIMTNHYHLLLKTEEISISKVMGIFNKRYTDYFNQKYRHVGHVFQQRFNSSPILSPQDLLQVSKYIHRNPISTKKPMVARMEDYPYCSYKFYKKESPLIYPFLNLTDLPNSFILQSEKTTEQYCKYVEELTV